MTHTELPFEDLERVYEALAVAIDRVGPDQEALMLAKLVLMLAQRSGDVDAVLACIAACAPVIDSTPPSPVMDAAAATQANNQPSDGK